jgi:cellulose biosynthesis protein BcsQ
VENLKLESELALVSTNVPVSEYSSTVRQGSVMDWLVRIDWSFLESFFEEHGRLIAAVVGFFAAVFSFGGAYVNHLRVKWELQLDKKNRQLEARYEEIKIIAGLFQQREADLKDREAKLNTIRTAVLKSESELWRIHEPRKFSGYDDRIAERQPPIIMVSNLKGGVGKSTLTANLAAYFDIKANKRVLVIDLDHQGSLSSMLCSAAEINTVSSDINKILAGKADYGSISSVARPLSKILKKTSLITSFYALGALESQLMLQYLLQEDFEDDRRYRLAKALLTDEMRKFGVIIMDAPPRLTAGAINAFCAGNYLLVPTVLDGLSAEAVGTFLNGAKVLRNKLNPSLELLGIVGTMTYQQDSLRDRENKAWVQVKDQVAKAWGPNGYCFRRHIPRKAAISEAAGNGLAYLEDATVKGWFDELGDEISVRIGLKQLERMAS